MQNSLIGKTAVITGASGGIGLAIAKRFADAGAELLLHVHRNRQSLEPLVTTLRQQGKLCQIIEADFLAPNAAQDFVGQVTNRCRSVDIWIHAAGLDLMQPDVKAVPYHKRLQRLFTVDLFVPMEISRLIGPAMKANGNGVLVFFSWDGVDDGWTGETAELYGAVKGGVLGFCRSLAESLAPEVRVCCLAPGWIRTRWAETINDSKRNRYALHSLQNRWGTPDEVADAVLFLVQERSQYVDGINFRLNGGKRGTVLQEPSANNDG